MTIRGIDYLKSRFETGDYPTQCDFWDWLDTMFQISADQSTMSTFFSTIDLYVQNNLTVGNLISTIDTGTSIDWYSAFTTVLNNSASWEESTDISALSAQVLINISNIDYLSGQIDDTNTTIWNVSDNLYSLIHDTSGDLTIVNTVSNDLVNFAHTNFVHITGDIMQGSLDMGGYNITGVNYFNANNITLSGNDVLTNVSINDNVLGTVTNNIANLSLSISAISGYDTLPGDDLYVAYSPTNYTADDNLGSHLSGIDAALITGDYLPLAGGTMSGDIDMDGNDIINIGNSSLRFESGAAIQSDSQTSILLSGLNVSECIHTGTFAEGNAAHAEGYNTHTEGEASHAEGYETYCESPYTHAEGYQTAAQGEASHAEGYETYCESPYTHAEGYKTAAQGEASHAEGYQTETGADWAHAEGQGTTASGEASHAEGANTTASGTYSHAEGEYTKSEGYASHAEGHNTIANGNYSHAEGANTTASGTYGHAEGESTTASEYASHAEGEGTIASGYASHAEGQGTTASGEASHAEGMGTTASGEASHAEGMGTTASGEASHAEGLNTIAAGNYSHAAGRNVEANHESTWVWSGNASDDVVSSTTDYQFVVSAQNGVVLGHNVTIDDTLTVENTNFGSYALNTSFSTVNNAGLSTINVSPTADYSGAFYNLVISNGGSIRSSNVMLSWIEDDVVISETATTDIGNTDAVVLTANCVNGEIALQSNIDSGHWVIGGSKQLIQNLEIPYFTKFAADETETITISDSSITIPILYTGTTDTTGILVVNGESFYCGDSSGHFAFDISGDEEWVFTTIGETQTFNTSADVFSITWADTGSQFFDVQYLSSSRPAPISTSLLSGLALYLPLNEEVGTYSNDYSQNNNNGTIAGGVTLNQTGVVNKAMDFDGSTGYISIPSTGTLNLQTNLTYSCWVKFTGEGTNNPFIMCRRTTGGIQNSLARFRTSHILFSHFDGEDLNTGYALNDDIWYFIVMTYNQVQVRYWVGAEGGSLVNVYNVNKTKTLTSALGTFDVGRESKWLEYMDGLIDEVAIWNRALSETEITELYNSGNGVDLSTITNAVGWLKVGTQDDYYGCATSSTGQYMIATSNGAGAYVSTDYGANWSLNKNVGGLNRAVACSDSGQYMCFAKEGGIIYYSTDYGATWNDSTSPSAGWWTMCMSGDGAHIYACSAGGQIYKSTDYGASWSVLAGSPSKTWYDITCSLDGSIIYASIASGSDIDKSIDYGASWSTVSKPSGVNTQCVRTSSNGQTVVVGGDGTYMFISTNGGTDWTQLTGAGSGRYFGVDVSGDGQNIIGAKQASYIVNSKDGGTTWTSYTAAPMGAKTWYQLAVSRDGSKYLVPSEAVDYIRVSV